MTKLKIARVSTVPFFMDYQLSEQIQHLVAQGHEVYAITSPEGDWGRLNLIEGLHRIPLRILRRPAPLADFFAAIKLFRLFRRERFDVVHSYTPKAGLLCAIAARLAGVPLRVHTFTGQQWATKTGSRRWLLARLDRLIVKLDTKSYADSFTQRDFLVDEGVAKDKEIKVLGKGSLAGVSLKRFCRGHFSPDRVRQDLGCSPEDVIITFVGRLTREKGVFELLSSFKNIVEKSPNVHLLLVGPFEDEEVEQAVCHMRHSENLHVIGPTSTPEKYLSVTDVFCLPSYREGFGTVVIEAAAMGVPTVGSDITGLCDAVVDGKTGLLVESKNSQSLQEALQKLIENKAYRKALGLNAFYRCLENFDSKYLSKLVADEYIRLWREMKAK